MDLIITTFQAIAILIFIGIVGVYIIHRKMVPEDSLKFLSPIAVDIALPALVFSPAGGNCLFGGLLLQFCLF